MSMELTPDGTEAYRILRWAQEDPASWRVAEAQRQMTDLARPLRIGCLALHHARVAGNAAPGLAGADGEIPARNTVTRRR